MQPKINKEINLLKKKKKRKMEGIKMEPGEMKNKIPEMKSSVNLKTQGLTKVEERNFKRTAKMNRS